MIKTIIKEAGIVILLLLAMALVLGIIFYEYIPNNKTVPVKIEEYAFSEEIQTELKESVSEGQNIVKTYYIGSEDLDLYESTNDYDKGKANPFADYSKDGTASTNTTSNNSNTNKNANTNANTNTSENNQEENENRNEVYINTPGKNY